MKGLIEDEVGEKTGKGITIWTFLRLERLVYTRSRGIP
jgi:hypothetical protein